MELPINQIMNGDALTHLKELPDQCINMVMTSPPYWGLRDYGIDNQLGLEDTFYDYINKLCDIFDEVKRILRDDGVIFVNIGDTYYGGGNNRGNNSPISDKQKSNRGAVGQVQQDWSKMDYKTKSLCMIPSRFAIEMINRGWILRNEIIWYKRNAMPSSAKDRFNVDFEKIFFFTKNKNYFFETQYEQHNLESIKRACRARTSDKLDCGQYAHTRKNENVGYDDMMGKLERGELNHALSPFGRNKRCVWDITLRGFSGSHFAVYPEELCETPIKSGCPEFVCNKCGKPREKIFKYNNLKEEGHGKIVKKDEPYSVQHREGEILVRDLPEEKDILEYLRKWKCLSNSKLAEKMNLPLTSVSHWFSDLDSTHGFSYPTKEHWIKLKELFNFDDTYDLAMTKEYYKSAEVMGNEYKEVGLSDCGCNAGFSSGIVLDMFFGAGTTGIVALKQGKKFIGIELNSEYIEIAKKRLEPYLSQTKLKFVKEKENGNGNK